MLAQGDDRAEFPVLLPKIGLDCRQREQNIPHFKFFL
jgi:hypothetical protein